MNEQLQKELAVWLSTLRESAQSAGNFAIEQAPLVVQEKILYGRISAVFIFVIFLGLLFAALRVVAYCRTQAKKHPHSDWSIGTGFSCLLPILFAVLSMVAAHDVLYVFFAPRLYIIEWLAGLLK